MGSAFVCKTLPDMPEEELARAVASMQSNDAYEHGHCDSGGWGGWGAKIGMGLVVVRGGGGVALTFDTERLAQAHLMKEYNDNGAPLAAVRSLAVEVSGANGQMMTVADPAWGLPLSEAAGKLKRRVAVARAAAADFREAAIKRVRERGKPHGCRHCGSRIAVAHIQGDACPVCRKPFLLTAAQEERHARLQAEVKAAEERYAAAALAEFKALAAQQGRRVWVVGGACRA